MKTIIYLCVLIILIGTAVFLKYKKNPTKDDLNNSSGGSNEDQHDKKPGKQNEFY